MPLEVDDLKTLKKKSMHDKARQRFEDGLKAITKGLNSKGGTKKRDKVNERLGRLRERFSAIQKDYQITFTYDVGIYEKFVWYILKI